LQAAYLHWLCGNTIALQSTDTCGYGIAANFARKNALGAISQRQVNATAAPAVRLTHGDGNFQCFAAIQA